ncbi:UPF0184 domain containing protein [Trichuris trichiura]|uniref:UPF0184 domain containing protein n=1 Tax=Trichuris trichiura TaxID=36087 RepID=A0A077Z618_TRITR|nr:UPF0184 domain containing protein [Trichuris trichiura]
MEESSGQSDKTPYANEASENGEEVRFRGVQNGNGFDAVRRGLTTLAETEIEENLSEIRKLDSQIDHLNDYIAKVERRNSELNDRLQTFLESQRKERAQRRASFYQRQQESREEEAEFNSQVQAMLMRCQQARNRANGRTAQNIYESA